MSTENCAIINSGTVANVVVADPAVYVPPGGETIVALGTSGAWIGWGATETGGVWSWTAPVVASPSLAQQAAAAAIGGVTVTLSGSLTLAATLFPTDAATQGKLAAVMTVVNATGAFPGGVSPYPMKDASGAWHAFTVTQYRTVAAALAAFVAACDLIVDGNPLDATTLPASSVSLTV